MIDAYYTDEDDCQRSPGLERVYPRAVPTPSPSPIISEIIYPPRRSASSRSPPAQQPSSALQQTAKVSPSVVSVSPRRRRIKGPKLGDMVLVRAMDPNRPDIVQQVGERALAGESEDEEEFEMRAPATFTHRDSVLDADIKTATLATAAINCKASTINIPHHGPRSQANESTSSPLAPSALPATSPPFRNSQPASAHHNAPTILNPLSIPQSRTSDKLPALQPQSPPSANSAASPAQHQQLPSFRRVVDDISRSTSGDSESGRSSAFPHRASISSSITQSPTAIVRQLSISSQSPATPFPSLSASSPLSASSDLYKGDPFLQSGRHPFGIDARRPSQVSECGRYAASHSNPAEGYPSPDSASPGSAQQVSLSENRPRHASLDCALAAMPGGSNAIILPPPNNSGIQHVSAHGPGIFKCDHEGCKVSPFHTQYLLNSHTKVHSQNRPHYCPEPGCQRGEGGKGFKRKNEMIRHGLVHRSPGYVCPFCPDREHKYPRPDNLLRHVRVHHVDKAKEDPLLRDVLAQRPDGGSRSRRRRVSGGE